MRISTVAPTLTSGVSRGRDCGSGGPKVAPLGGPLAHKDSGLSWGHARPQDL